MKNRESLPVGWELARFDKFLKRVERKFIIDESTRYDCVGVRWYGMGAFVREQELGMNIARKQQWRVKVGDVLYNKLFAWKSSFAIADESVNDCIVSDKFPTYQANQDIIDLRFLKYYFQTPKLAQQAQDLSKGAAAISKLTLNPPQFWELTIPLPPLPEQQRIVARIEELARRVEEARGLRRAANEEANNLVNAHLSAIVRDLEKKCEIQPLEKLLVEAGYGTSVKCESERINGAIPVLRIPNVASEKVTLVDLKYGFLSNAEVKKTMLREGDLLIVRTNGSADLVGRCAVIPNLPEATAFASYMIRIRCDAEKIHPHFLQLILRHQRTAGQLIDFARTTAGQYNVSLGRLRNTKIPLPQLDEQHRIVAYLDNLQQRVDELRRLQAATQKELDALMPSVLAKAFAGEL